MAQTDVEALESLRTALVTKRRVAALAGNAEAVVRAQEEIATVDLAIADELALLRQEKDELALSRAIKRDPDASNIEEISLVDNPIRVSD